MSESRGEWSPSAEPLLISLSLSLFPCRYATTWHEKDYGDWGARTPRAEYDWYSDCALIKAVRSRLPGAVHVLLSHGADPFLCSKLEVDRSNTAHSIAQAQARDTPNKGVRVTAYTRNVELYGLLADYRENEGKNRYTLIRFN